MALGKAELLELGNLDAKRDWGHARDYVKGMRMMLQHDRADTFVLATNRAVSVRDFVSLAFTAIDISIEWFGAGIDETGIDSKTGKVMVRINPKYYRPAEVDFLLGDAKKAKDELGWESDISVEVLCKEMVEADLRRNRTGFSF